MSEAYLAVISVVSDVKADAKSKATLNTLRVKKNTLRILPFNSTNKGMVCNRFCAWTIMKKEDVIDVFGSTDVRLRLNNPKGGHICKKKIGYKEYSLFKTQFIDRMYLRL